MERRNRKTGEGEVTQHIIVTNVMCPPDVKHYYSDHMSHVTSQPRKSRDLLSSLLEKNASEFAAQQEWEAEWNQLGLASRLSEEVRTLLSHFNC